MVKGHFLSAVILTIFILVTYVGAVAAWSGTYHLDNEWVKIWINQNGTIDLFYNVTLTLDSGDNINTITVGQPKAGFTVGEAIDQDGNNLSAIDVSQGSDFKVKVTLQSPLQAGQTIWFTLNTNVAHMIYNDTQNPGNVGMQFTPTWYNANIQDLRVSIVLPPNVTTDMVKTSINWTNAFMEDGQLAVYWEKNDLSPNEQFPVGISFPKEYVQNYDTQPPNGFSIDFSSIAPYLVGFLFLIGLIFIVVVGIIAASKKQYLSPQISMETLGVKHGLTAVEASYLLDLKPTEIVTEILYSLLKKRAVWVEATKPSIKLRIMLDFKDKAGSSETPLRYYEVNFLKAIGEDGALNEEKLAETVMSLRDNVEEKMRGYCRQDTIDYYRNIVTKAWTQVEQAGTPELASNAYDEQLLWLLLDPNMKDHTQTAFQNRAFEPNPLWLWYWYGYTHYNPNPIIKPSTTIPTLSTKPPAIPGAEFANNVATSLESTANNIVVNVEKFANSIIPAPPSKASNEPTQHNAACVCACHACACACACVSCACACAGGGVG
jgi:hypothetical protein